MIKKKVRGNPTRAKLEAENYDKEQVPYTNTNLTSLVQNQIW